MKKQYCITILLLVFMCQACFAQTVSITCRINGTKENDSVALFYFPKKWGSTSVGVQKINCGGTQGEYNFRIPELTEPCLFTLTMLHNRKPLLITQWMEPGDSIFFETDTTLRNIRITGNNAAKNRLELQWQQWKAARRKQGVNGPDAIIPGRYSNIEEAQTHLRAVYNRERVAWKELTAAVQQPINPLLFQTMTNDIGWNELKSLLACFNEAWEKSFGMPDGTTRRDSLQLFYATQFAELLKQHQDKASGSLLSETFLDFAVRKTMTDARIQQGNLDAVEAINYLPLLKQWPITQRNAIATTLITYLYTYSPNVLHSDQLAEALLDTITDDNMNSLVKNFLSRLQPGAPMYPFVLRDAQGKIWSPAALKGKAVVMDFWYNGCKACVILESVMRKVKASMGKRNDIAYVSISIDPTRERWQEALKSGLYTDPENINLFTEGLAGEHPMVKHYAISAYPRMLLFSKDGKIVSADAPKSGPNLVTELSKLIDAAAK